MNETENIECQVTGDMWRKNVENLSNDIIKRKRHFNQKYDVDFSWFISKNTEEFAYFLGFFYADGYNNQKVGKITITLEEKDKEILEKFSDLFFGHRPILMYNVKCQTNNVNGVCSLNVGSKFISKLLSLLGASQNKTFKIRFPYWLDKSLHKHFIRGYFDGDGSIGKCNRNFNIGIASNWEFNSQLKDIILDETGLKFGIIKHGNISILYKGGNKNAKRFLDWLYSGGTIYLKRKYDRYQELLLERVRVDDLFDHVSFRKSKNYWYFRLPSKYGRDYTGGFLTEELAITAYKEKLDSFKNV